MNASHGTEHAQIKKKATVIFFLQYQTSVTEIVLVTIVVPSLTHRAAGGDTSDEGTV